MTDIVFLRRRAQGEPANHVDPAWCEVEPVDIEGVSVPINRYFVSHPEMVLGTWSRKDRLYGVRLQRRARPATSQSSSPVPFPGCPKAIAPPRLWSIGRLSKSRFARRRLSPTSRKEVSLSARAASSANRQAARPCPSPTAARS